MVISVISKWQNIPSTTCVFQSNDLLISPHVKQLHLKKTKDPIRASVHASLFPPTSINGLPAHYVLQKYTVTVSHLFHLRPSRCVWAASGGGGRCERLMQCVGCGDEQPCTSASLTCQQEEMMSRWRERRQEMQRYGSWLCCSRSREQNNPPECVWHN